MKAPATDEGTKPIAVGALHGVRALVVDDDDDAREMFVEVLRLEGAEVTEASSAKDALELNERWRPDVLVSDIGMPVMDGYTMMSELRGTGDARGGLVPAIALTGYASDDEHQKALRAGYQMHMSKPIAPDDLVAAIAGLVASRVERR